MLQTLEFLNWRLDSFRWQIGVGTFIWAINTTIPVLQVRRNV